MSKSPSGDKTIFCPPDETTKKIMETLEKAGAAVGCTRCAGDNFAVVGGFIAHQVQPETNVSIMGGGEAIGTVVLVCRQCGYVIQHALADLAQFFEPQTRH